MNYYNVLLKGLTKDEILTLLGIIEKSEKTLNNTLNGLKRYINTEMNLTLNIEMVKDLLSVLTDYKLIMKSESKRYYVNSSNVKIWIRYNYNINFYKHYGADLLKQEFNEHGIYLDVPCYY